MKDKLDLNTNAVMLRKKFGEDSFSPIDIFSIINNRSHFSLVFRPLSNGISGLCIRVNTGDNLIAINSTSSKGRQRFTAAHELYHLFFQDNIKIIVCEMDMDGKKSEEERNADVFASFFLAPDEALKTFIEQIKETQYPTLANIVKIEQHFGMSHQATLFRLKSDGYITAEYANLLKSGVIKAATRLGYDTSLYLPTPEEKQRFTTGNYIDLAEQVMEKELVSQGKYEEYLLDAYRSDIVYNLDVESAETYD